MKTKPILCLLILILASCATRPDSVTPVSIPASDYSSLSCQETTTLLTMKNGEENALSKKQSAAATGDAVGVFLILLPISTIFGGDVEGDLAQAKGEVLALQRAIIINCN